MLRGILLRSECERKQFRRIFELQTLRNKYFDIASSLYRFTALDKLSNQLRSLHVAVCNKIS